MLDVLIILGYFAAVMLAAVRARLRPGATSDDYFVAGRGLRWYSVAASTIATNPCGGCWAGPRCWRSSPSVS